MEITDVNIFNEQQKCSIGNIISCQYLLVEKLFLLQLEITLQNHNRIICSSEYIWCLSPRNLYIFQN